MSINLEQLDHACRIVSRALSVNPDLDVDTRANLEIKVAQIAKTALPEALKQLKAEEFPLSQDCIPFLVRAIENEILQGCSEEIVKKIRTFNANRSMKIVRLDTERQDCKENLKAYHTRALSNRPTFEKLTIDFKKKLQDSWKKSHHSIGTDIEQAIEFYEKNFQAALIDSLISNQKELFIFPNFIVNFLQKIQKTTCVKEITREEFQILIEEKKRGRSKLDFNAPILSNLLDEYENGLWSDKETRMLSITYVSEDQSAEFKRIYQELFQTSEFEKEFLKCMAYEKSKMR